MRKILSKFVIVVLSASLLLFSLCGAASADNGIKWGYNEATKTVTVTGKGAITDVTPINDYADTVENIVVSEGITSIGAMVFSYLENAKTVTLPSTLKSIDEKAFYYSGSIEKINLPEGLESIGSSAFCGCASLEELTIPKSLSSIGINAFGECHKLRAFKAAGGSFADNDGVLMNAAGDTVVVYPTGKGVKSYTIPDGVKTVGAKAFTYCIGLENVVIPASVEKIDADAFYFCKDLKHIEFEGSVKTIGDGAFYGCAAERVILPMGTESIGRIAFKNSHNLKYIYIPATVKTIGEDAFYGTSESLEIGGYIGSKAFEYAGAAGIPSKIAIGVSLNGREIEFDQPGTLMGDYTMVPMRKIFEALGAEVSWDDATSTATGVMGGTTVSFKIGDSVLYKNGSPVKLNAPAVILNDRTLVHVRAIAEAFGGDVGWDGENGHVTISYKTH